MSAVTDPAEQYRLITQGLQEVLHPELIKNVLEVEKRPLKVYWGTAPTGKPHCGYFVPMTKLAHFLKAGCEVTVLLADLHAFLDNMKAPLEVVKYRAKYYEICVKTILKSINVPIEKLKFVLGSSYQLTPDYTMDIFKLSNRVSQNDAKRAGADVVKQVSNPLLSGLIYPLMQALDEQYLDVDVQFGGVDQRKIFVLAEENLEAIGYKKRAHLMNHMVPGLARGGKMSASDPNSKIDLLEEPNKVKKKIKVAFCEPNDVTDNALIAFIEFVLMPIYKLKNETEEFKFPIKIPEKYGGDKIYDSLQSLKDDYANQKLSPVDLKSGLTDGINELLKPIRDELADNQEFKEIAEKAYPSVVEEKKKTKKVKNKGSRYPGGAATPASTEQATEEVEEKLKATSLDGKK